MKTLRDWMTVAVLVGLLLFSWFKAGIRRVSVEHNVVALTFDDGPNPPYTDELLQILEEKQVKATFFLIGQQVIDHPETAQKILRHGHEIGGHSSDWESLAFVSPKTMEGKLQAMEEAFVAVGITHAGSFRPPGGLVFPWHVKVLDERDLAYISADVVVGDWKVVDAKTIRDRVLQKVRPGSIVALHDGGGDRSETIAAVPLIIDALKSQGYEFATVSELQTL